MRVHPPTALFRCDASPAQGYGHVSRCLAVARELRALRPWHIVFVLGSAHAREQIARHGHEVLALPAGESLEPWLEQTLRDVSPDIMLLDAPQGFPETMAARRAAAGGLTVVLDDAGPLRRYAQAAYYPPAPVVPTLNWQNCQTEVLSGFAWVPLGEAFTVHPRRSHDGPPRLLVTMGGSDPARLTLRALDLLQHEPLRSMAHAVTVVVGPYFAYKSSLEAHINALAAPVAVVDSPADMGAIMGTCDLALASFGVCAYELAACGIPAAYYCLTPGHAAMAEVFANQGMALNFGVHDTVRQAEAARKLAELLQAPKSLERMGRQAALLVDDQGAQRIAADMVRRLEARK